MRAPCAVGLAAAAESLNGLAAKHWRLFSTQNYFDEHGVFASALFSTPLLFTAFVILLMTLKGTADLLVVAKRAELRLNRLESTNSGGTQMRARS